MNFSNSQVFGKTNLTIFNWKKTFILFFSSITTFCHHKRSITKSRKIWKTENFTHHYIVLFSMFSVFPFWIFICICFLILSEYKQFYNVYFLKLILHEEVYCFSLSSYFLLLPWEESNKYPNLSSLSRFNIYFHHFYSPKTLCILYRSGTYSWRSEGGSDSLSHEFQAAKEPFICYSNVSLATEQTEAKKGIVTYPS